MGEHTESVTINVRSLLLLSALWWAPFILAESNLCVKSTSLRRRLPCLHRIPLTVLKCNNRHTLTCFYHSGRFSLQLSFPSCFIWWGKWSKNKKTSHYHRIILITHKNILLNAHYADNPYVTKRVFILVTTSTSSVYIFLYLLIEPLTKSKTQMTRSQVQAKAKRYINIHDILSVVYFCSMKKLSTRWRRCLTLQMSHNKDAQKKLVTSPDVTNVNMCERAACGLAWTLTLFCF